MVNAVELSAFNQQLLLLLGVLLFKVMLQKALPHEPWRGFRFYCQKLAEKVNKAENSSNQQHIAGFVAVTVTFLPLWIIAWLFESLVAVPVLWHILLLYLAVGAGNIFHQSKQVAIAVTSKDNYKAKQLLAPLVKRDTEQLSALGLSKASIEMQLLTHVQQYVVPAMLFLMFGPLTAFSYRLLLEMHYSWNIKQSKFEHFGQFAATLSQYIQWLPTRLFLLFGLILTLGQNFLLIWRLCMSEFFNTTNNCLLALFAPTHNIKLGGVAMYSGVKLRKPSFNDNGRQPEPKDIIYVQKAIWRIYLLMVIALISMAVVSQLLTG